MSVLLSRMVILNDMTSLLVTVPGSLLDVSGAPALPLDALSH